MGDQSQWVQDMIRIARSSFEMGIQSMDMAQAQAQKNIEVMMANAGTQQDVTKSSLESWFDSVNKARKLYLDTIEEGLSNLEQQFSSDKKR
ncbi:MAG: hypothetical protein QNJ97_06360 [Myxococcota bacterium]|nr:hypothetical protein [Myxococcota bacterium]